MIKESIKRLRRNIIHNKMRSFLTTLGIIIGWTPARKASNLNPIDALRCV